MLVSYAIPENSLDQNYKVQGPFILNKTCPRSLPSGIVQNVSVIVMEWNDWNVLWAPATFWSVSQNISTRVEQSNN